MIESISSKLFIVALKITIYWAKLRHNQVRKRKFVYLFIYLMFNVSGRTAKKFS